MESQKAKLVAKTMEISGNGNTGFGKIRTTYFATFEFEDKSRKYWEIQKEAFLLLAEGDEGILHLEKNPKPALPEHKIIFKSFERML